MKICVVGGRVIDATGKTSTEQNLFVENGKIVHMGDKDPDSGAEVVSAEGCFVAPGFIDLHTHTREPGNEEAEDIKSCSEAALAGGFTAISPMPNTVPACDRQEQVRFIKEKQGSVKLYPVAAVTMARAGKELTEMAELKKAGVLAVSDDGVSVADTDLMRRAMEYASMLDLLMISHCEHPELAAGGLMNEGAYSARLGLAGMPSEAETIMVARDLQLAELTGCRLHIAHISTAGSVELVRQAKARGLPVSCEVTPHHFSLTEQEVGSYDSVYKVNPPLRSEKDVESVRKGLKDGTIDAIATDHAPHLGSQKEREFEYAPFGMIGLQTALSVGCEYLVRTKVLSWEELIGKLTCGPARVLGIGDTSGALYEGAAADLTVFSPDSEWEYSPRTNRSRSENSPFLGRVFKGTVEKVIADGKVVFNKKDPGE